MGRRSRRPLGHNSGASGRGGASQGSPEQGHPGFLGPSDHKAGKTHLPRGSARPWPGISTGTCPNPDARPSPQTAASPHCQGQLTRH